MTASLAYPLATSYGDVGYHIDLDHVVLATTLEYAPGSTLEVTLEPLNRISGWKVRSTTGTIGWLDAAESADYPALERLRRQGLSARTTAEVNLDEVTLDIGLADWHIARNNQPVNTILLAGGTAHPVNIAATSDLKPSFITRMGTASYFVELRSAGSHILAVLESRVLGDIGVGEDFPLVTEVLEKTPVSARVFFAAGKVVIDLPADPDALFLPSAPQLFDATNDLFTECAPAVPEPATDYDLDFDAAKITPPLPAPERTAQGTAPRKVNVDVEVIHPHGQ